MCSMIDSWGKGYKLPEQILFNFLVLYLTLGRKCKCSHFCKRWDALKRILMRSMLILQSNHATFKNIRAI